jgi:hypothetical protein
VPGWAPLLLVPAVIVLLLSVLLGTVWLEEHLFSPRFIIGLAARGRTPRPEKAEQVVATQSERLLGPPMDREAPPPGEPRA